MSDPERSYYVYLLASRYRGTLYVGMTENLFQRLFQHETGIDGSFTQKYAVKRLVWLEGPYLLEEAGARERRIKRWRRAWKIELVEADNPDW